MKRVLILALMVMFYACQPDTAPISSPEDYPKMIGKTLPDFELMDLSGKPVRWSELKGQPALINFWFTRCPPCVAEIPHLNEIRRDFRHEQIHFLAISPDKADVITPFLSKHPFDFTIIPDAQPFIDLFGNEFPLNIFIDKEGIIRHARGAIPTSFDQQHPKGYMDDREFRRILGYLLRE
jgi:cytochrome c biogenesis protein CcmG, thiol:disulfide interchange protein DsbE